MRLTTLTCLSTALVVVAATTTSAQIARTRSPGNGETVPATGAIPRNPQFPYAGLWQGTRTMPLGSGDIVFRFSVVDSAYGGATLHPDGGAVAHRQLASTPVHSNG